MTEPPVKIPITAEDRFSRTFAQLKRDLGDTRGSLAGIAGAANRVVGALSLGTVAGVGGMALAVRRLSDDINALNDAADATGASVENISKLEAVARRNGASVQVVTDLVSKLNQALNSAKPDSAQSRALKQIGLEASALRQLDPAEAVQAVAKALAGFEENGAKARVSQLLLGEEAKRFAPLLRDIARAGDVSATVTSRQADEAARFSKGLQALEADLQDTARAMALTLLPSINQLFAVLKGGPGLLNQTLAVPLQTLGVLGANVAFVFRGVGNEIGGIAAQAAALARGDFSQVRTIGEIMRSDAKLAREEFDRLERQLLRLGTVPTADYSNEGRNNAPALKSISDVVENSANKGSSTKQITEAERLLETLRKQADQYDRLSTAGKLFADIEAGRIQGLTPALQRQLELEAQRVDALSQAQAESLQLVELQKAMNAEKERQLSLDKFIADQVASQTDRFEALLADTQLARIQRAQQQIDILRQLLNEPGVDADRANQILEAIEAIKGGLQDVGETGKTEFDKLLDAVDNFAENAIEAVLDFADTGELSFSRLFRAFSRDILRELIEDPIKDTMRNVVATIKDELGKLDGENNPIKQLFGFLQGLGSGGGDLFGNIASIFSGFTGRANGGGVSAGSLVRWQEGGREWFVPQEDGTVLTQAQLRGMQGGHVDARTTIHVNGDVSAATVGMLRRMLDERDVRLARSMQHGRLRAA